MTETPADTTALARAASAEAGNKPAQKASNGRIVAMVLVLTGVITLMLRAFLTPAINSGPKDLPLAVAGPDQAVNKVVEGLEQKQPGAFEVTNYESPEAARDAIKNRDAIGGIAVEKDGIHVLVASGAGTPYKQMFNGLSQGLQQSGQKVNTDELAPTTEEDPTGLGLSVLAMPLAFGGMASAAIFTATLRGRRWGKIVGSVLFSFASGFVLAAIMQFGFHSIDGNYLELASILGLGIAGTSMFVLGLESLLGAAGLGIGAILTIFIANPLSGIGTGWQWLPSPWGAIGQYLPIGAAGNAVRSVAYFDGNAVWHSVFVLFAWMALGYIFVALSSVRNRRQNA